MSEQDQDVDQDMQAMDMEGEDMDAEFRGGECVELEFNSDDDVPPESDDEDLLDEDLDDQATVSDEKQLHADGAGDEAPVSEVVDDAVATGAHKESVLSVAFCPADRRVLVTGGQDDVAVLWGLEEQDGAVRCVQRCRLEGHTDSVAQVAFSHDGQYVATGAFDGTVKIWTISAASGAAVLAQTLEGPSKEVEFILWHPKGHAIVAGSADTMAWMWWAPTGKLMQIFAGHAQSVTCGCWGLGGKVICTGSQDHSVVVWNPRAGTPQQHLRQAHEAGVVSIAAHPEAPIVVSGSENSTVRVSQIETGKVVANLSGHSDSVESISFSNPAPIGFLLMATAGMDGKVLVWDAKTFDLRCTLKDHVEKGGVVRFKWLPQGTYGSWLCTCSTDNTLRLFNGLTGESIRTLSGHTDTVLDLDLALGPAPAGEDGAGHAQQLAVASASDDGTCRLFVVALGREGQQQGPSQSQQQGLQQGQGASSGPPPAVPAPAAAAPASSASGYPGAAPTGASAPAPSLPTAPPPAPGSAVVA